MAVYAFSYRPVYQAVPNPHVTPDCCMHSPHCRAGHFAMYFLEMPTPEAEPLQTQHAPHDVVDTLVEISSTGSLAIRACRSIDPKQKI